MTGDQYYYRNNEDKQYHDTNRSDSINNGQSSEPIATYEKTAVETTQKQYHNIPVTKDQFQSYNIIPPSSSVQYNLYVFQKMKRAYLDEYLLTFPLFRTISQYIPNPQLSPSPGKLSIWTSKC
jgi:hypothetical protein